MKIAKLLYISIFLLFASAAHAEPAAVIMDGSCRIPTPSGIVLSTQYHKTATYSKTGVAILKCKFVVDDYTDGQFHDVGFECGLSVPDVGFFVTTDTMLNVSASGKAMLTCKVLTNVTP
jgi:hypothetical protein